MNPLLPRRQSGNHLAPVASSIIHSCTRRLTATSSVASPRSGFSCKIAPGFRPSALIYFAACVSHALTDLALPSRHGNLVALFCIDNWRSAAYELTTRGAMTASY